MIAFVLGLIKKCLYYRFNKVNPEGRDNDIVWIHRVSAAILIVITSLVAWAHILWLRFWAFKSEWIQLNPNHKSPEDNFSDINQLVPLISMTSIVLTSANEFKWPCEQDSIAGGELQNIDHEQLQNVTSYNNSEFLALTEDNSERESIHPHTDRPRIILVLANLTRSDVLPP
ncbi:hypothetical protein MMC22_008911 [Lobaria immixta]|nr:hypothetical protein [Lobaria immixta]